MPPFVVDLSEVKSGPGASMSVKGEMALEPIGVGGELVAAAEPAMLELAVENVGERSYVVRGTAAARLTLTCSRCLKAFEFPAAAQVEATFTEGAEKGDDAYPVSGYRIDVAPAVIEALLLEVPFARVCSEGCLGLCPVCGAERAAGDCGCEIEQSDPRLAELEKWMKEQTH